jgi:hypothetical protein
MPAQWTPKMKARIAHHRQRGLGKCDAIASAISDLCRRSEATGPYHRVRPVGPYCDRKASGRPDVRAACSARLTATDPKEAPPTQ